MAVTAPVANDTFELWPAVFSPAQIHRYLNQALIETTGKAFDTVEDTTLHGDSRITRFDIPSGISIIHRIEYRKSVLNTVVHACDALFDGVAAPTGWTNALDSEIYKVGPSSNRFTLAATVSLGDYMSYTFTFKDLSGYTRLECWARSNTAQDAADYVLDLYDGTTVRETVSLPALTADTWTWVSVAFTIAATDHLRAITSVRFRIVTGTAATVLWLDDIRAVAYDDADWKTLSMSNWQVDKNARDLVLVNGGESIIGDSLIKIVGGDKPAMISTAETAAGDADVTEVSDDFVVARATHLALMSASGGAATDPDDRKSLAAYWGNRADKAYRGLPFLVGRLCE